MILKKNKIPLALAAILNVCSWCSEIWYYEYIDYIFDSYEDFLLGVSSIIEALLPFLFLTVVFFYKKFKKSTTTFLLLFSTILHSILTFLLVQNELFFYVYSKGELNLPLYVIVNITLQILICMVLIKENENEDKQLSFEEGHYSITLQIVFSILFGAIYKWVWINRTTKYLNIVKDSKKRNSGLEIILCMFVPFYTIYWTYQSALRIEKLCKEKKIEYMGDFVSVATVLEVLFTVISAIYMQNRINDICLKVKENNSNNSNSKNKTKNNDFDELREYKKLLDEEIITQEEFEKKKKEILNL